MKKSLLEKRLNEKYHSSNLTNLFAQPTQVQPKLDSLTEKFNKVIDEAVEFDKESSEKGSSGGNKTDRSSIGKDESSDQPAIYVKSQVKKKLLKSIKQQTALELKSTKSIVDKDADSEKEVKEPEPLVKQLRRQDSKKTFKEDYDSNKSSSKDIHSKLKAKSKFFKAVASEKD